MSHFIKNTIWFAIFCFEVLVDLWSDPNGCRSPGLESRLYNRTAAVWVYCVCVDLWDSRWERRAEVWKCLSGLTKERHTEGWESKMLLWCCDKSSTVCVQVSLWVITVCAPVCVHSAPCHYHPWLLITGTAWPVEVHLGRCSHLSRPLSRIKLI